MASQITSVSIVYSVIYSGANQRKHQSSASLAFLLGIHRWRFHLMTSSCYQLDSIPRPSSYMMSALTTKLHEWDTLVTNSRFTLLCETCILELYRLHFIWYMPQYYWLKFRKPMWYICNIIICPCPSFSGNLARPHGIGHGGIILPHGLYACNYLSCPNHFVCLVISIS